VFAPIFAHLPELLFALALASALLGLLIWTFASQGGASKRTAYVFWLVAGGLALLGFLRWITD
jgi:hypothetical protein